MVENINPSRLPHGRHLLYMDTTTKGISGSPLYKFDPDMKKALAIGVHVGGNRDTGNAAVPLWYHNELRETLHLYTDQNKITGKLLPIFIG